MVEELAKAFLGKLAYSVYGNDPRKIQDELRLLTRKIPNLALGKVVQAQRTATSEESSPRDPGSDFGVFVSHSSADGVIAERVAMGLRAMGYNSWYAEWELKAGDSIVERIQAALSASDVLIVVLSPRSVASEWVQRELNSVLMAQLSGQRVRVVPALIETCEIPRRCRGASSRLPCRATRREPVHRPAGAGTAHR